MNKRPTRAIVIKNEAILENGFDAPALRLAAIGQAAQLTLATNMPVSESSGHASVRVSRWPSAIAGAVLGLSLAAMGYGFVWHARPLVSAPAPQTKPAPFTRPAQVQAASAPTQTAMARTEPAEAPATNLRLPPEGDALAPSRELKQEPSLREVSNTAPEEPGRATAKSAAPRAQDKAAPARLKSPDQPVAKPAGSVPIKTVEPQAVAPVSARKEVKDSLVDLPVVMAGKGDRIDSYKVGQVLDRGDAVRYVDRDGGMVVTTARVIAFHSN